MMFGGAVSPARGFVARWTDKTITYMSLLFEVGLLILVVDTTYLCYRFVVALTPPEREASSAADSQTPEWPEETQNRAYSEHTANARIGPEQHKEIMQGLQPLLRVKLIAGATDVVARMIYYPFIVLFLLIIAENTYFDNVQLDIP